jgi:hypothetical protein
MSSIRCNNNSFPTSLRRPKKQKKTGVTWNLAYSFE